MTKKNDRFFWSFSQHKNTHTFLNHNSFPEKKSCLYILSYQSDSNLRTKNHLFNTNFEKRQKKMTKKNDRFCYQDTKVNTCTL